MVGEDLQLAGEVDPAYVDALGHREDRRGEVEDAADADLDHPVDDRLRRDGRGRDHPDPDAVVGHDLLEVLEGADLARKRRLSARNDKELAKGPARLATALGVDRALDGTDACASGETPLRVLTGTAVTSDPGWPGMLGPPPDGAPPGKDMR